MKKLLKFLLAMLVAVVIIVGVLFGIHSYNSSRFAVPGANPRDKSSYETSQSISPIEGTYLNGFHFLPTEKRHQGVVITFGGSEGSPVTTGPNSCGSKATRFTRCSSSDNQTSRKAWRKSRWSSLARSQPSFLRGQSL